jgi:DnaJ family protein B protein 4
LNLDGRTTSLKKNYKLLQIKPGFGSHTKIEFKGEGHESINRKTSNLIFQIFELNHSKYIRNGQDLIYHTDISLADALNCKSIEVETLDNRIIRVAIDEIIR